MLADQLTGWMSHLPTLNAALNAATFCLLVAGFRAIKGGRVDSHRKLMVSAFVLSGVFLASYLTYHWALNQATGSHGRPFSGTGAVRVLYFFILITHVILAGGIAILAPLTLTLGLRRKDAAHRRWARITFPIWLYVSITGVVIYGFLYL